MKTVLISGCDRGVGFCLAEEFLRGGWSVYAGQYLPRWSWLNELSAQWGEALHILPLDVGSDDSVRAAAAQVPALDMLVLCAGVAGGEDDSGVRTAYQVNSLGAIRMVEAFLPRMEQGLKRLAFVSSEAGVISIAHRDGGVGYTLSKAMLNMAVSQMFRQLRPLGFTFRLYHPGWVRSYMQGFKNLNGRFEPEESAAAAYRQFVEERSWEDALAMTDISGHLWPW